MKPWKAAALVLVVLAVGVGAYAFWPQITGAEVENAEDRPDAERVSARARVQAIELQPTDFLILAEATGHLTPWREAGVSPEASGLVRERLVNEGARVAEGQALLRLDSRDQELELEEAASELLQAQLAYAERRVGYSETVPDSALLERARRAFEQAQAAYDAGNLTLEEFQIARRAHDADVLRSGSRRNEVEAVLSGLEQAEQRVRRTELTLSRMTVRAPFPGRVANLEVEEGQRVGVGETVLTLLDDARMKVTVNVLEADIVGLRKGAVARVRVPALNDTVLTGRIWSVNPTVDRETGTGRVTVEVPNTGGTLLSGLFAYVQLESGRLQDRMVVPAEAVLVRQGRDLVFVVKDGRAQWTYVTTGRRSGGLVEILEPLVPGDSLAVAGHHALSHDARVVAQ